jgi:hypothetical protein
MKQFNKAAFGYADLADVTSDPSGRQTIARILVVGADEILLSDVLGHAALRLSAQLSYNRGQCAAGLSATVRRLAQKWQILTSAILDGPPDGFL